MDSIWAVSTVNISKKFLYLAAQYKEKIVYFKTYNGILF